MIRVGLGILTGQTLPATASVANEYQAFLTLARAAEDHGFDSVWVSEHHFSPDAYLPSLLPMLGAIAAVTSRIELGTATLLAPFHHPLRIAEDAAVVDQLSGGRLTLGVASGWRAAEFGGFGITLADRAGRLAEMVHILHQAWHGPVVHQGRHFRIEGVEVWPKPAHPIPILLGGFVDRAVARAGQIADGFIASADEAGAVQRRIEKALTTVSDADRLVFRLAIMLDATFTETPGALEGYRYKQEVYRRWRAGIEQLPALPLPSGAPDSLLLHGDDAAIAAGISRYLPTPLRDITVIVRLNFPGMRLADSLAAVRRFGTEVIPRVREVAAA